MSIDTSTEAVSALIADCDSADRAMRKWVSVPVKYLRALLDERDAAVKEMHFRELHHFEAETLLESAQQRIHDLEAEVKGVRGNASLFARQRDTEIRRADRAEAECDRLHTDIEHMVDDHLLARAEGERDRLTEKLKAARAQFNHLPTVDEFLPWARSLAASLADTTEPKEQP